MTDVHPHNSHGHSVAAWTGVIICLIGAALVGIGILIDQHMIAYIGAAVFIAGGLIGWAMGKAKRGSAAGHKNSDHRTVKGHANH